MAGKMKREINFSSGSHGRTGREIQKAGDAARHAAEIHGALAELVANPTGKKFAIFLNEAGKKPKKGEEKAREIKHVLDALNDFVESRQPEYSAIANETAHGRHVPGITHIVYLN